MKPGLFISSFRAWKENLPTFPQWQVLPRVLSDRERTALVVFLALLLGSALFLAQTGYLAATQEEPAPGGTLRVGITGHPRFLNPAYAEAQDADRDLVELLYSGLLAYAPSGELVPDLAQDLRVLDGNTVYEVTLKEGARWHDGFPVTADDVVFTVETVQDPRYKSPLLANWLGVKVSKVSDRRVRFELRTPFAPFPERLTLSLLPAHLWKDIAPENFPLSLYNLKPVGTGPYRFKELSQDKASGAIREMELERNPNYHGEPASLQTLIFQFFAGTEDLLAAARRGQLDAYEVPAAALKNRDIAPSGSLYEFRMPRAFAVFFNLGEAQAKPGLQERAVRRALEAATDREKLVEEVFGERGVAVRSFLPPAFLPAAEEPEAAADLELARQLFLQAGYEERDGQLGKTPAAAGPISSQLSEGQRNSEVSSLQQCLAKDPDVYPAGTVSGFFGPQTKAAVVRFQEKYAAEVLAPSGFTRGTGVVGPSTREKLNQLCGTPAEFIPLTGELTYPADSAFQRVAQELQSQWGTLGMRVQLNPVPPDAFEREVLKPRNYEMLLFGEILGTVPDPYPFWHSSQAQDPGLNIARYQNAAADRIVESLRRTQDDAERLELLGQLSKQLAADAPALFLYDIPSILVLPDKVKGAGGHVIADPSQRFSQITDWYIETKRVFK